MNSILPSIMQSIKPQYCELIAAGKKTIEVRKTRPKIETPFKSYIYQTWHKWVYDILPELLKNQRKVIGEYICDDIVELEYDEFEECYMFKNCYCGYTLDEILSASCLSYDAFCKYGNRKPIYLWHITNLKIYDEPKELSDFYTICNKDDLDQCGDCKYIESYSASFPCEDGGDWWCTVDNKKPLTRPFQSWGYVYEID